MLKRLVRIPGKRPDISLEKAMICCTPGAVAARGVVNGQFESAIRGALERAAGLQLLLTTSLS